MRKYAAVGTLETEGFAVGVVYGPVALYDYGHRVPASCRFNPDHSWTVRVEGALSF
jgi:hypothetical protein